MHPENQRKSDVMVRSPSIIEKRDDDNNRGREGVVGFVVGNTYQRIPKNEAKYNRNGTKRKVHDWILYVDVIDGDARLIHYVNFNLHPSYNPSSYTCYAPVRVILPDGSIVQRFKTRQQSYGKPFTATIVVVGSGGSIVNKNHKLVFDTGGSSQIEGGRRSNEPIYMTQAYAVWPLPTAPLPQEPYFRIELELFSPFSCCDELSQMIQYESGVCFVEELDEEQEKEDSSHSKENKGWRLQLVQDDGNEGNIDFDCQSNHSNHCQFRLISPFLQGNQGVEECELILSTLEWMDHVSVNINKPMDINLDVSEYSLECLVKICQNFIKYEDAIDTFTQTLPSMSSRGESIQYCASNKIAMSQLQYYCDDGGSVSTYPSICSSNSERHKIFSMCSGMEALVDIMNPNGCSNYKLNLQNLRNHKMVMPSQQKHHRPSTARVTSSSVEFRQHFASSKPDIVHAWIAFCVAFVHNSARFQAPRSLKESRSIEDQFVFLFKYVIKDRGLEDFFKRRREELMEKNNFEDQRELFLSDTWEETEPFDVDLDSRDFYNNRHKDIMVDTTFTHQQGEAELFDIWEEDEPYDEF